MKLLLSAAFVALATAPAIADEIRIAHIYDRTGADNILLSDGDDDTVLNAKDFNKDVFRWTSLNDEDGPEWDKLSYFDVVSANHDQIDVSGLGNNLVADIFGSAADSGALVIYRDMAARDEGAASLVIEWDNGTPIEQINVGIQSGADIRIGFGWQVYDAISGDTFF